MAKNLPKKPQVFFIFLLAGRHAFGGMIQTIGLALRGALQQNGKIRAAPAAAVTPLSIGTLYPPLATSAPPKPLLTWIPHSGIMSTRTM